MHKGRFSEEQIINVKGGPAAAQLHLTPRRNRFRQRPVQVRTRLSPLEEARFEPSVPL